MLQLLKNKDINRPLWDSCVQQATHSLPYALSWYLDCVAENWDALVWGNYDAVMALPWLRKLGVKCIYQPYYCQQTGIFSKTAVTPAIAEAFLSYCRQNFSYVNLNLNPSIPPLQGYKLSARKNLLLPLHTSYAGLRKGFSENHRRNIAKAEKKGLVVKVTYKPEELLDFYIKNINPAKENFKPQHEKIVRKLVNELMAKKAGKIYYACNAEGTWVAASLLITCAPRLINIINTSSTAGKATGASHLVFNEIIKENAGQPLILDFEGSSIPSIARFYEGFGAQPELFYQLKHYTGQRLIQLFR